MKTSNTPRSYGQIERDLLDKHGHQVDEWELRRIHRKWRSIGKTSQTGQKYQ